MKNCNWPGRNQIIESENKLCKYYIDGAHTVESMEQFVEWFDLKQVGKSPSRFDFAKLKSVNKHYIKEKNEAELLKLVAEFFSKKPATSEEFRIARALKFVKERAAVLNELAANLEIYFDNFRAEFDEESKKIIAEKKSLIAELQKVFANLNDWNHDGIKDSLNEFATQKNLKIKDFGPLLRIILTFSQASAGGIFDVIEILGKSEVERRVDYVISKI